MVKLTFTNMFLVALLLLALTSATVSRRVHEGNSCLDSWVEIGCKVDVRDTKCKKMHSQTAKGNCATFHCVCSFECHT
ncbi:uncharacterized protein DS421_13g409490 [Arachis hypogaea]|nr:uncharacterized protein DS421_13g409490 [Arachis hypogaea]